MRKTPRCPTCKAPLQRSPVEQSSTSLRTETSSGQPVFAAESTTEHAPFCSARCRDIDLGTWLNEGYRISRPMTGWELDRAYGEPPEGEAE